MKSLKVFSGVHNYFLPLAPSIELDSVLNIYVIIGNCTLSYKVPVLFYCLKLMLIIGNCHCQLRKILQLCSV